MIQAQWYVCSYLSVVPFVNTTKGPKHRWPAFLGVFQLRCQRQANRQRYTSKCVLYFQDALVLVLSLPLRFASFHQQVLKAILCCKKAHIMLLTNGMLPSNGLLWMIDSVLSSSWKRNTEGRGIP